VSTEFGRTWWGRAWVEALEQRARLDPNRLPRGRDYARSGAVGELILAPGEARARVQGRKTEPYEVRIRVRRFTDAEWDRVLTAISARLGHAAALLDGELPPQIAEDAADAGLDLLPGGGEIGPRCSCPDDADPCKHSAAACYLVTDALDADPFVLLLLRGRTRDQVLAGVRARRRGALGSDLFELAADAAARAWEMAVGLSADSGLGLSADVDLARRAGRALGTPAFVKLAVRSGVDARELARQALAWRNGGLAGLEVLHSEWDPATEEPEAPELLRAARSALRAKNDGAETVVQGNRITTGRLQLRLDRDLRWFPYARSDGDWEPSGPPDPDPARAVADL
jgi:uncharacterized Zn finger protein